MAQIRIQAIIEKGTTQADATAIGKSLAESITSGASSAGAAVVALQTTITKLASTPIANPFEKWSSSLASVQAQIERTLNLMRQVGGASERPLNFAGGNGNTAAQNLRDYGGAPGGGGNAAEEEAALSRATRMSAAMQALSAAEQAHVASAGNSGRAADGLTESLGKQESILGKLRNGWRSTVSTLVELAATYYIVKSAADGFAASVEAPYIAIAKATEDSRRFELAIQPFVGGAANARAVDTGIATGLNSTPLSLSDNRQLVEALTRVGPIAEQLANATPQQVGSLTGQYAQTISGLQALNPATSTEQIISAVESSLLGQGRGLRSVVRIDPDQLAELVGKNSSTAFRNNPQLLMSALSQYTNLFSPSGSAEQLNNMPSVQVQHIKDEFQLALQTIGDSGLFDELAGKIRQAADSLLAYVASEDYQAKARSIGQSLGVIFDNVTRSALVLLQSASGADKPADTLSGVAGQVDEAFKVLGAATGVLPNLASGAGQALHQLGVELAWLVEKLNLTVESAAESAARIESLTSPTTWFGGKDTAIDQLSQRNTALAGVLNDVTGSQFSRTQNTTYGQAWAADPNDGILSGARRLGVNDHPFTQLSASNPYYQSVINDIQTSISSRGLQMNPDGSFMSPTTVRQIVTTELQKYGVLTGSQVSNAQTPAASTPEIVTRGTSGLPQSVVGQTDELQRRAISIQLGVLSGDATEGSATGGRSGGNAASDTDVIAVLQNMANAGVFKSMTTDDTKGFSQINSGMMDRIASAVDPMLMASLTAEYAKQLGLEDVISNAPDQVNKAIAVGGFSRAAGQRDPMLRAQQYNAAIAGTTGPAQYAAGLEGVQPSEQQFGLLNVPQSQRIGDLDASVKANLEYVKATGGDGAASQGFDLQRQIAIYQQAVTQTQLLADATTKGSQAYQDANAKAAEYGIALQKLSAQQVANQASQIQQNGGIITTGMTAEQVQHMASTPQTSSLLGGEGRDDQEIALYTTALANAQSQMATAKAALDSTSDATAEQQQAFLTAAQAVDTYTTKIDALKDKNGQLGQSFVQLGNQAQTSLESTLGQALTDIELKTGNVSQAFRSMATEMLGQMNKTFTSQIFNSVLGTPNGKSGAGNGGGGLLGAASGGLTKLIGNLFHFGDQSGPDGVQQGSGGNTAASLGFGDQGAGVDSSVTNPTAQEPDGVQGVATNIPPPPGPGDTSILGSMSTAQRNAVEFGLFAFSTIGNALAHSSASYQNADGVQQGTGGDTSWSLNYGDQGAGIESSWNGNSYPQDLQYHAAGGVFSGAHLAVIAEGGQQEAVVPMPGGYLPVGVDSSGLHAMLPGGRKVPAAMHASGGVFGSSTAFTGAATSPDAGPQYGPNASNGRVETHHYIIVDSAESAWLKGFKSNRDLLVNVVAAQAGKAGGPLRKTLRRPGG